MGQAGVRCVNQTRRQIITCFSNENPLSKSGTIWLSFSVFLMLLLFLPMQLSNGGVGKESHGVFSSLLCYGVHGSGGIIKS